MCEPSNKSILGLSKFDECNKKLENKEKEKKLEILKNSQHVQTDNDEKLKSAHGKALDLTSLQSSSITSIEEIENLETTKIAKDFEYLSCKNSSEIYKKSIDERSETSSPYRKNSEMENDDQETVTVVRRSRRLSKIRKGTKILTKRGHVECRAKFSVDEHLLYLAEVEAENAKFLKDLNDLTLIKKNEYQCERTIGREAHKMLCDCFLTAEEEERGDFGCGENCLNRMLMIECGPKCNNKDRCTNKRFQLFLSAPCRVFRTEKKGFGIMAINQINRGEFIMEYVGEVIDDGEFENRLYMYSQEGNQHYYFMALRSDAIIDATRKGNISRFINHSCDPNAETQKWTVNGELRIGFFCKKTILPGEEITFDYQYQRYGRSAQRCFCESTNCRGWIGGKPHSSESSAEAENYYEVLTLENLSQSRDCKIQSDIDNDEKDKSTKLLSKSKSTMEKKSHKRSKKIRKNDICENENKKYTRSLEEPDIQDEIFKLTQTGLRNQSETLRFSRLMVKCKLIETRLELLKILRKGELSCRRLFLDYHGLRLLYGWMRENSENLEMRFSLLETLKNLPITNKTILSDTKIYQTTRNWSRENLLETQPASSQSTSDNNQNTINVRNLAENLIMTWKDLPEMFRIPKRERREQMKEHEREANWQPTSYQNDIKHTNTYKRNRFGRKHTHRFPISTKISSNDNWRQYTSVDVSDNQLTKHERRQKFAEMYAQDEGNNSSYMTRAEIEMRYQFFGLDKNRTRQGNLPFYVNRENMQWYSVELKPISTPPASAHIQVAQKKQSTNPADYELNSAALNLPKNWSFAITDAGKIYYYHIKKRVPQWEPPKFEMSEDENMSDDSISEDEDIESLKNMNEQQLEEYIVQRAKNRKEKRKQYSKSEYLISPRREEDRLRAQIERRRYRDNKKKLHKRKIEKRRKRHNQEEINSQTSILAEQISDSTHTLSKNLLPLQELSVSTDDKMTDVSVVQDMKSNNIDNSFQSFDVITEKLMQKKTIECNIGSHTNYELKRQKADEKLKPKSYSIKDRFCCDIAETIVEELKEYRKETCSKGRITNNEDFNHLVKKLTQFVMIKEGKYVGENIVCNESVKNKARKFIENYMAKYGKVYIKPTNDPQFKNISNLLKM